MNLYLLRHAHAEPDEGIPDERRALTEDGRANAHALAELLRRQALNIRTVFTSPRLRATQTADIVAAALEVVPVVHDALDFGFSAAALGELLRDVPAYHDVMLVGHEPTLSECLRTLTGASVQMKKCGLARVELLTSRPPYRGDLLWLVPPKVVRGLTEEDHE
ncbi:MAG: histidine phosphatase family protein [Anaerolineae bacterium]|jgi:phosphohistidine phosphatase|nr:histidine phosphatase family protein [Anaerolineae bacterium]